MPSIDPVTIDALLPQTQCTQCGFDGCLPYAAAIAAGEALVNRCAPGGDDGIRALADLTGRAYMPLDPAHGIHKPRVLAVIDEARCIGCTICIQKCPVDAIAGAAKLMHTVIADECTGCELCVAPCPVDCIALVPAPASHPAFAAPEAAKAQARNRYRARLSRLATKAARRRNDAVSPVSAPALPILPAVPANAMACATPASGASFVPNIDEGRSTDNTQPAIGSPAHKRDAIAAALERARARRIASAGPR